MAVPSILKDNLSIPVIGSPLFIISNPDLVIAQCKAGVIGSFPSLNARPEPVLEEWLDRITSELKDHNKNNPDNKAAPFAVNQIVNGSNGRLKFDMDMCEKYEVPIIITSLGAKQWVNDQVHGWGGIVLHDIINNRFAKSAVGKGADGLIAVAAGAGGHAGQLSPFALDSGNSRMVRRSAVALRVHGHWRLCSCSPSDGRGHGLHWLCLHCDRRSQCG